MLPALSPTSKRAPAQAARSPSPEQSMKMSAAHRLASGLGLDHQRVDAAARRASPRRRRAHERGYRPCGRRADRRRRSCRPRCHRPAPGSFPRIRCGALSPPSRSMRAKQLGSDALHHPMHLAVDIGMQSAEVRHPRRRAHAAEKTVALDQQRPPPRTRRSHGSGDPGGSAAEHGDFIFAIERYLARGFFDGAWEASWDSRMVRAHHAPGEEF